MRTTLMCFLVLFLATASYAAETKEGAAVRERCPVCGMYVSLFADWNAKITFSDSTAAVFDGPKDLFKYYLDMKKYAPTKERKNITTVTVKDYYSKKDTDAYKAFYVIWGDVYGPMGHEPIPFATEADAKRFLQEHHGKKVLKFKDITLKLLHSLDNPE